MAPNAARARKAARRAQEEAAAAAARIHSIPTSAEALAMTEKAERDAEDGELAAYARDVDNMAMCVSCSTVEPGRFSQRMLHKRGRHGDRVRRCRQCTAEAEATQQAETARSVEREGGIGASKADACDERELECAGCELTKPAAAFSRTQVQKLIRGGCARCLKCTQQFS